MSSANILNHTQQYHHSNNTHLTLIEQVAYVARVSNPSHQSNHESAEKLVKYLIKNKHWSPLEMVDVTLEITTTRDIARQLLRHRSFSFQEFSQRYATPDLVEEGQYKEVRMQDMTNRQSSHPTENQDMKQWWQMRQEDITTKAYVVYHEAIRRGIAKEVARVILPEGLTVSRLYIKGSLRSWIHYLSIRLDASTQKEHRELAQACKDQIATVFPLINEIQ